MNRIGSGLLLTMLALGACTGDDDDDAGVEHSVVQTDWSGGAGNVGPLSDWGTDFDLAAGIAWRSVEGQLALASSPLDSPAGHLISEEFETPYGVHGVDLDLDGDTDVIGAAHDSGDVIVWLNDGASPPGWNEQVIDDSFWRASAVHAADLDGDGLPDVVAASDQSSGGVTWWRNDGGDPADWPRQDIDDEFAVACGVHTADVDGDGQLDVLSGSWTGQEVAWWHNDGGDPIGWTKHVVDDSFDGSHEVFGEDLDGDGDVDLTGVAGMDGEVSWWRNDGGDQWVKQTIDDSFGGARSAFVADIDGDGSMDVVATGFDDGMAWWRNGGGDPIEWTRHDIDAEFAAGHRVEVMDLDGDGDLDVLGVAYSQAQITWWRNEGGSEPSWTPFAIDGGADLGMYTHFADVDGDGDLDVLGSLREPDGFYWWDVLEFGDAGTLDSATLDLGSARDVQLEWDAVVPDGTDLVCRVRGGAEPDALGDWMDVAGAGETFEFTDRYVQVRIAMESTAPGASPVLRDVTLTWTD